MFAAESQDLVKPQKATQVIIDKIRSAILSEELESGQRLPIESELMRHFGVSRQTIRGALCALESMGLIKIRSGLGGGPFVSEVDIAITRCALSNYFYGKDFAVHHITEVRLALEPYASRMAARYFSFADKLELREILVQCERAIDDEMDIHFLRQKEFAFHSRIVEAMANPVWKLLHDFADNLLWEEKRRLKTQTAFSRKVLAMHYKIMDAIDAGDADSAEEYMRQDILHVDSELTALAGENKRLQFF